MKSTKSLLKTTFINYLNENPVPLFFFWNQLQKTGSVNVTPRPRKSNYELKNADVSGFFHK